MSWPTRQSDAAHEDTDAHVYDDGCLRVEHDNYYASCDGTKLLLSRKEFLLISLRARHPERTVRTKEVWRHVWGAGAPLNVHTLKVHLHRLRQHLSPFDVYIKNELNKGYRLLSVQEAEINGKHAKSSRPSSRPTASGPNIGS